MSDEPTNDPIYLRERMMSLLVERNSWRDLANSLIGQKERLLARVAELEAEVKSLKFEVAELTNRVDDLEGKYPPGEHGT